MSSLPMGQEVAVTMPQLAAAFSIIANGGYEVSPHLVDRVSNRDGENLFTYRPNTRERILSEETAATMRELCHLVVTGENTGRRAAIKEYRVGGKTGTAQIAKPNGGGYYRNKYTTVFAGFAPIVDPQLTCVIVVSEPNIRNHYGGYVCGPVFKEVVREALIQMGVPPDPMQTETDALLFADMLDTPDTADVLSRESDLFEPSPITVGGLATVVGPQLPDLLGLSKREAKEQLVALGLPWDPIGAGHVTSQEPAPGTPLADVQLCRLHFGPRLANHEDLGETD